MTEAKLEKIRQMILACRRKINKHRDLEQIVLALERRRVKRGKEPTYESIAFPNVNAITIPDHAGRTVKKGTAATILNQCQEDVYRFEEKLEAEKGRIQNDESGYTH